MLDSQAFRSKQKDPNNRCLLMLCCGEIFEQMQKGSQAQAQYEAAAACEGASEELRTTAKSKIAALQRNR